MDKTLNDLDELKNSTNPSNSDKQVDDKSNQEKQEIKTGEQETSELQNQDSSQLNEEANTNQQSQQKETFQTDDIAPPKEESQKDSSQEQNQSQDQSQNESTKVVDKNASYEVPDFSEDDIDIDLGIDGFTPDETSEDDVQDQNMSEPAEDQIAGEPEENQMAEGMEEEQVKEKNLEEQDNHPKKEGDRKSLPTFEETTGKQMPEAIFLERKEFISLIVYKDKVLQLFKSRNSDMDKAQKVYQDQNKYIKQIRENLEKVKTDLLNIDNKIFEEGEIDE